MRYEVTKWTSGQTAIKSERGLVCLMEAGNQETRDADAAFIVRACNAYDVMLAALKECRKALNHHGIVGDPASFMADEAIERAGKL